jgi:hypothetical protein
MKEGTTVITREKGSSISRVMEIIEAVAKAERPLSPADLSFQLDIPKPSVHRLANQLQMALPAMTPFELLDSSTITGAPMAPILSAEEAKVLDVFRPEFADETGSLSMPCITKRSSHKSSKS